MQPGARAAVLSPDAEAIDVAARGDPTIGDVVDEPDGVKHIYVIRGRGEGGRHTKCHNIGEYEPGDRFGKLVGGAPN